MYPVLLFDGDCAFCTASVNFLTRYIRPKAQITAWQHADLDALGVSAQECQESIQWFAAPGSSPLTQGRAVAAALRCGSMPWPLVGRAMQVPGIIQIMNAAYRLVAANRFRLPGSTPACRLPDPAASVSVPAEPAGVGAVVNAARGPAATTTIPTTSSNSEASSPATTTSATTPAPAAEPQSAA